jgi:HD-GYP domain-containing protein (c-di-GMP phosphodiesterase class II)
MEKKTIVRPGRTVTEKKIMQIPVSGLKVGMYVRELDRPWLETPFILQGFPIRSVTDIDEIAKHCQWVIVEVGEEAWRPAEERILQESRVQRTQTHAPLITRKAELNNAQNTHQHASALTRSFMDDVRLGRGIDIKEVKATVSECVRSILRNPDAMQWMAKLRSKDEYTSEHSLNVGLLAIAFGRHLGASEEDLNKLGISGMLHDVGKMQTPNEILLKEGKLTDDEYRQMKMHAQHGRDILLLHRNLYQGAVDVAYSHHENLDGSGYPRGIKSSGITDFTRIVSLCDVYDAITSDRIYKKGASSLNALKIIQDQVGKQFDVKLAQEFVDCIGLYPPGSVVELHTGELGIVINTNHRHRHLPKVMIVRDSHKQSCQEHILNLEKIAVSGATEQLIKNVLPNGVHGIRVETFVEKGLLLD